MKKEKIAEDEKGRKRKLEESSNPAAPVTAPTPARKRGRPKKIPAEEQSDESLAEIFAKKKR